MIFLFLFLSMINKLRLKYRKLLLKFIPARSYVLEIKASPAEIVQRLSSIIQPDKLYFFIPASSDKPYSGKFGTNKFVAIKNNAGKYQRQIKVRGFFYIIGEKIFIRLILSNPFSVINLIVLGIFYLIFLILDVTPFSSFWLNLLLWITPVILTYLITNISFQLIYKKEKQRFFKLFNGRRLSEKEIRKMGI